jgi:hypothetical protein
MEHLEEFFLAHPDDARFEIEQPEQAAIADTNMLEKLTLNRNKKTEFEIECQQGYRKVVKDLRAWVRDDRDIVIAIDGTEGEGKSHFLLKFAKDLDSSFILERNILFRPTPNSIEERIFQVNQYGVLGLDEAMESLYKRQSATSGNIGINKLFARVRKFNRIVILALPDFSDLDPFFRKRRVRVRVNIIERGLGFIMVAKNLVGNDDPWFMDFNKKIMDEEFVETDMTMATPWEKLAMYRKYRCFVTPIMWDIGDVPTETWERYKKMAVEANLNAQNEEALRGEHLTRPDKAYRRLFAELSKRFILENKYTPEEAYALFQKMLGSQPPFTIQSFKFLISDKKDWKQQRKEAKIQFRDDMKAQATKPKDLMGDL